MNNETMTLREFQKQASAMFEAAAVAPHVKQAAAPTATDPTLRGEVSIPDCGPGSNRKQNGLPPMVNNFGAPTTMVNTKTQYTGTGQGEYPVPANGTAKDQAVTSPTAPMSKLSGAVNELLGASSGAVQAASNFSVADLRNPDMLSKLASLGQFMLGSEEGQQAVLSTLEKAAGANEARAIINQTLAALGNEEQAYMDKVASARLSHEGWLSIFDTDFEKQAYMQGAEDGEAAAQAAMAGEDPTANEDEVSPEEVLQYLQELVESGQISEDQLQALIASLEEPAQDGLTQDELAAALEQAVQSGQLAPEAAQAIAQQVLAGEEAGGDPGMDPSMMGGAPGMDPSMMGGDPAMMGADPSMMGGDPGMDPAMADPNVKAAAYDAMQKAASVVDSL